MNADRNGPPSHVVVVGAGNMGLDIAAIFLAAGATVDVVLRNAAKIVSGRCALASSLTDLESASDAEQVHFHTDLAGPDWSDVDLVVEAVCETLDLKRRIFGELAEIIGPDTIVTSNASSIPISRIVKGLPIAARATGLHFFLPAHLVPLVEVVCGSETDPAVAERVVDMVKAAGRVPVLVRKDTPGFVANRLQHALMREVFAVLDEGLACPEDIDAAVCYSFGMRFLAAGPILQKELSGLDTQWAAAREIYPILARNTEPGESLSAHVGAGRFGTKTLRGFADWTPEEVVAAKSNFRNALRQTLELMKRVPLLLWPSPALKSSEAAAPLSLVIRCKPIPRL